MNEYDAQKDCEGSYYAAIEAKRLRGDTHDWEKPWRRREQIGDCTLYLGDCLEILPTLAKVDAVITDPPYSSGARTSADISGRGGMSRGQRWAAKPLTNDRMTVTGFMWMLRHVAADCYDLLPEGGSLLSFIDWRQYPTLYGVVESVNFRVQAMVVWDKEDMALGNGFRNQHELLIHAAKGVPSISDRSVPNVLRFKRISSSDLHPTEKPVPLLDAAIRVVTSVGQTVLDPFMGSGTAGVACTRNRRKFIGIEIDERYFDIACERIRKAYAQPDMFVETARVPEPVQEQML